MAKPGLQGFLTSPEEARKRMARAAADGQSIGAVNVRDFALVVMVRNDGATQMLGSHSHSAHDALGVLQPLVQSLRRMARGEEPEGEPPASEG